MHYLQRYETVQSATLEIRVACECPTRKGSYERLVRFRTAKVYVRGWGRRGRKRQQQREFFLLEIDALNAAEPGIDTQSASLLVSLQ